MFSRWYCKFNKAVNEALPLAVKEFYKPFTVINFIYKRAAERGTAKGSINCEYRLAITQNVILQKGLAFSLGFHNQDYVPIYNGTFSQSLLFTVTQDPNTRSNFLLVHTFVSQESKITVGFTLGIFALLSHFIMSDGFPETAFVRTLWNSERYLSLGKVPIFCAILCLRHITPDRELWRQRSIHTHLHR